MGNLRLECDYHEYREGTFAGNLVFSTENLEESNALYMLQTLAKQLMIAYRVMGSVAFVGVMRTISNNLADRLDEWAEAHGEEKTPEGAEQ